MVTIKFSIVLVLVTIYNFLDETHGEQFDIWGDVGNTNLIIGISETRYAFPFIQRTLEFTYPNVSIM